MRIFELEASLLSWIASRVDPEALLIGTFDPVDLTDSSATPWLGKLTLMQLTSASSIPGSATMLDLIIGFSVYCDLWRSTPDQKTAAADLFDDAANALCSWQYAPMRYPTMATGLPTADDGRILRLSVAITIPQFFQRT